MASLYWLKSAPSQVVLKQAPTFGRQIKTGGHQIASFCTSCGTALTGAFCTTCGASQAQTSAAPAAAYNVPVAAPKRPKNPAVAKLFLPIGLAAVLVLSLAIGITQALQISKHAAAAEAASELALSSYESADSFDSLAADARYSKDACYYNIYCSADSYSNWINIVDTDEALAESSRQTAQDADVTADRETKAKVGSQVATVLGFVFAGLSAAGLGLVLVLRGRKKKAAPAVTYDADAATPAE